MTKQEQNLKEFDAKVVFSAEIFQFSNWLEKHLNIDSIDVNLDDLDSLPISCRLENKEDLIDIQEATNFINKVKDEKIFDINCVDKILCYLIHQDELPFGIYDFSVDC